MPATMRKQRKVQKREYDASQRQESSIAGPCVMCIGHLAEWNVANPDNQRGQRTRVYAKRGNVRFCRCDNCGNTWKKPITNNVGTIQ